MTLNPHIVLDTSAYSYFRRGHPEIAALIAAARVVSMPVIVLGELEAGFEIGRRTAENRQALADFLEEPWVEVVETTRASVAVFARIFAETRRAGRTISTNDIWIAAAATECRGHLLTLDRDFQHIPGLEHTLFVA